MTESTNPASNRRDFLSGRSLRKQVEAGGEAIADALLDDPPRELPGIGDSVRLQTRAMACDFAILMNPDHGGQLPIASNALEQIHVLEQQMTVYHEDSELSEINRRAFQESVEVEEQLFALLQTAKRLTAETGGAFDPTAGPLIALWKACRAENRIPTVDEIAAARQRMGIEHVEFEITAKSIRYTRDGLSMDLGGIGKGFALDRAACGLRENGLLNFLFHGGHSSLLACGTHGEWAGWPVGVRNPLFPQENFATIVLRDCALSSSGSGVQFFRHQGTRYGHILDPRSGMPAEDMLSVTVVAPSAAEADALSTAFFVMGLENAVAYCDNRREIGAVMMPVPKGRRLDPTICNLGSDVIFFEDATLQS